MADNDDADVRLGTPIGQIPIRRVSRSELEAGRQGSEVTQGNPMNRLVPYLDLFARLTDGELARLAGVAETTSYQLRKQVDAVGQALVRYVDLLPRLQDAELMRLTGASAKTIRFWRLCQPREAEPVDAAPWVGEGGVPGKIPLVPDPRTRPSTVAPPPPATTSFVPPPTRAAPPETPSPETPSPETPPTEASSSAPAATGATSDLGLSGAPFPGYDYDPGGAAALDDDEDGIFVSLELPEPWAAD